MRRVGAISTAVLSLLLGTTALTYGQQERHADRQKQEPSEMFSDNQTEKDER